MSVLCKNAKWLNIFFIPNWTDSYLTLDLSDTTSQSATCHLARAPGSSHDSTRTCPNSDFITGLQTWAGVLVSILFMIEAITILFTKSSQNPLKVILASMLVLNNLILMGLSIYLLKKVSDVDGAGLKTLNKTGCYIIASIELFICLYGLSRGGQRARPEDSSLLKKWLIISLVIVSSLVFVLINLFCLLSLVRVLGCKKMHLHSVQARSSPPL